MRLAIITPVFPPYYAGIGRVAEQEAEGLAKLGHEITVLTPLYQKEDLDFGERSKDYKIRRLKSIWKLGNAAWLPWLADELKNFDVVHLHYPFIGGAGSLLKYKIHGEKYKVPLVVTYHMDLVGRGWKGLFFKLYTCLTLSKMVKAADKIIVSSLDYAQHSHLAPYLEREPGKFVEVPFGVELRITNYELRIKELKNELGIKENDKVILFVGGLDKAHYFKGIDVLLKSFQNLIFNIKYSILKYKLLIVGNGDLRPYYEGQAKSFGMADRVIFVGRVSTEEMVNYYQSADVLVLPSTTCSEAYGLVLLEAMSFGLPVIASDLPGVRTNVSPERGILVQPGDSEGLSRALVEVLSDEEKRKQMGQRAREWVKVERSVEKEIAELDKIFKKMLY